MKNVQDLDSNMSLMAIGDTSYQWLDPIIIPEMRISGFSWLEKDHLYRRMPICQKGFLPVSVDALSNCCAGGQISFQTDSTRLAIEAKFAYPHTMCHMPPTGQLGFDCYLGKCGNKQFAATLLFDAKTEQYCLPLFENIDKQLRTFTINLPLYNGKLEFLRIGLEPNCRLMDPESFKINKRVVFYGTSITQGGCASRPGMCYTNILSRRINAEFINLGFSGNGKGEPEVMETIASIPDMGLLVIDYEANIADDIYQNLEKSISIVRSKHPQLPIAIFSRIGYGQDNIRPQNRIKVKKRRDFQKNFVHKHQKAGDNNIHFIDGSSFFEGDPGEYAVDGCHPTDLGFYAIANKLELMIAKLIS